MAVELEDPDLVAQDQLRGWDLIGVQDATQALVFGHRLIEGAQHPVEIVLILLDEPVVRRDAINDLPAFDDVDAVVAGIHAIVVRVAADSDAQGAAEEVADDLAEPRPSVGVGARRAVALELAVFQQRFDGVPATIPMQVDSDLPIGSGDDGSVSHDSPFRLAARPFGWPRGLVGGQVPGGVSGDERKPFRTHELSRT